MAIINREKLVSAYVGWHTSFNDQLSTAPAQWKEVAMETRSDNAIEEYKWINQVPEMRKWVGDRVIDKLSAEGVTIKSEDWANGVEVERDDLRDDKLGLVERRIRQLALKGVDAINREVFTRLNNAFTIAGGTTYDGQFLIDTDHAASTEGGQTSQSNKGTAALENESLEAGMAAMMNLKDPNGNALTVFPKVLITGPALWSKVRSILEPTSLANGATNINNGLLRWVMSPYITGNKWFLLDDSIGITPIIVQIRQDPEFRAPVQDFDDFMAFMRKTLYFGADMTFGTGLGLWQGIYGSDGSVPTPE
jgi:phage major head subunit gpT-like protein